MIRLLIIDDDKNFRSSLNEFLTGHNYEVTAVENSFVALEELEQNPNYDLILCDLDMPRLNGIQLLSILQSQFPHIPVIILTGRNEIELAVKAIKLGATNYIVKTKILSSLLDVIEATLLQHQEKMKDLLKYSYLPKNIIDANVSQPLNEETTEEANKENNQTKIRVDEVERTVSFNGESVNLTETEFDILSCLIEAEGDVCTYEQIMYSVHNVMMTSQEARRGLSAHVSNLRKKLDGLGCNDAIMIRRSRGYFIKSTYLST
jgi:DNA-binding response OmpR family regulator